jgi:hypothetical protein
LPNTIVCVAFVWSCTARSVSRLPSMWRKDLREIFAIARRGLRDSRVAFLGIHGIVLHVFYGGV